MIIDTSSLIAILLNESDAEIFIQAISRAKQARISAGSFIELSIVIQSQFPPDMLLQCDALFRSANIIIEPVTVEQAYIARQAFHDFGKGRHPAALNFGDCFAYALAKLTGEPLLFKGGDFKKSDIASAI
jgi:ribonuclease VapC